MFPLETTSRAGKRKAEKLRGWRRGLGKGERVARGREAGIGAMVLTVHHASVPPRSVEKWTEVVQEKAEKLQPQPTFLSRHFPATALEAKSSVLHRAGAGEKLRSHPTAGIMACSLPPLQLCVVGPPPDMMGGWDVAPSSSNPGWHIAIANHVGLAEYRI